MIGTNAKCESLMCCRSEWGIAEPGQPVAGQWGSNDGLCDLPPNTFKNMIEFVVSDISPDAIFWTGDNSAHTVWNNTEEEITNDTKVITDMIKVAIKGKDISVLPIQGNHDTWPTDQ